MLLPILLAASLWQASTTVAQSLSCYSESKNVIVCYDSSGQNPFKVYYSPKKFDYSDSLAIDLVANALGTAADLGSTDRAINKGCVEGNPLGQRVEGRVALKVGAAAFRGAVAYVLRSRGHKRIADVWRWAGLGTDLLIAGNNFHCGSKK